MPKDMVSDFSTKVIKKGKMIINGYLYSPLRTLNSKEYDGRLDGHSVVIKYVSDINKFCDLSFVKLLEMSYCRDKRQRGEHVFDFENLDKENGISLWPFWKREEFLWED